MGAYKNIEVAMQEAYQDPALREIVDWYEEHLDKLPAELMMAVLSDEDFFQKALTVWDNQRFAPKPASEHVALQQPVVRRRDLRAPKRSRMCVAGWAMIATAVVTAAVVLGVSL